MKKVILLIVLLFLLSVSVFSKTDNGVFINKQSKFLNDIKTDIERIEYVCTEGQWFQIIYYTDGTIGVISVNKPPEE